MLQLRKIWSAVRAVKPQTLNRLLAPFRFGGAVLLYAIAARSWLYWELGHVEGPPFSFDPRCCSRFQLAYWTRADVQFALWCTLVCLVFAAGSLLVLRRGRSVGGRGPLSHLLAVAALLVIGLLHGGYYKVAFVFHGQLGASLITEGLENGFDLRDFFEQLSWPYPLLVVAPALIYLALAATTPGGRAIQGAAVLGIGAVLLALPQPSRYVKPPLRVNPSAWVLESFVSDWLATRKFGELDTLPTPEQLAALSLVDVSRSDVPSPLLASATGSSLAAKAPNVVVVVLESVGRRYAFERLANLEPVMPFLTHLRERSLYFSNHLSPSNSSANSLFSFFTGLYPEPSPAVFSTRGDLTIPIFHNYLPWIGDAFLVTPGRLTSYFPRSLLSHAGVELRDLYNLGLNQLRPAADWGSGDERDGVDAFLLRLGRAESPFFGAYYSYAAHFAYYDHGPEFRVLPDLSQKLHRYYNNLRLLDVQLERIVSAVRARPEPTLLVVLGDHGEAFGQHKGNHTHSRGSYQENFETFALVNFADVFPERVITHQTLHVDLLPTILAGLGIPFGASQFQGQNMLAQPPSRPYVFLYGNEDTLSSIHVSGIKLQLEYAAGTCRAFNLATDPLELVQLSCDGFAEQMRVTGMYHAFQPRALHALQDRLGSKPTARAD